MITYAILKARILANCHIDQSDDDRFQVLQNINDAQKSLAMVLPEKYILCCWASAEKTLDGTTNLIQLPSDYLKMRSLKLNDFPVANKAVNEGGGTDWFGQASSSWSTYQETPERGIEILPEPSNGDELRIDYISVPIAVSETQSCMFDDELEHLLVLRATMGAAATAGTMPDVVRQYADLYALELRGIM